MALLINSGTSGKQDWHLAKRVGSLPAYSWRSLILRDPLRENKYQGAYWSWISLVWRDEWRSAAFLRNRSSSWLSHLSEVFCQHRDRGKLLRRTTQVRTLLPRASKTATKKKKGGGEKKASHNLDGVMSLPLATGQTRSNPAICGASVRNYFILADIFLLARLLPETPWPRHGLRDAQSFDVLWYVWIRLSWRRPGASKSPP